MLMIIISRVDEVIRIRVGITHADSVASSWRKSIIVWSLTVGSLEDGLGRLIDRGGGSG